MTPVPSDGPGHNDDPTVFPTPNLQPVNAAQIMAAADQLQEQTRKAWATPTDVYDFAGWLIGLLGARRDTVESVKASEGGGWLRVELVNGLTLDLNITEVPE